jgi:two-component system response regulator HydG
MHNPNETPRVLVVDDRLQMAEMIADELCDRGYAGIAVGSGREALRILEGQAIDAIVTDLHMPELDGFGLLDASLALDPRRPVIVMTAYGALDSAVQATSRGAYHYITKPFRLDALVELLDRALVPPAKK